MSGTPFRPLTVTLCFTKCTEAAIAPRREGGIRLMMYIDDWLLCTQSRQEVLEHSRLLLENLTFLGFRINTVKSVLIPTQTGNQISFLGLLLDSVSFKAHLSVERIRTFQDCLGIVSQMEPGLFQNMPEADRFD